MEGTKKERGSKQQTAWGPSLEQAWLYCCVCCLLEALLEGRKWFDAWPQGHRWVSIVLYPTVPPGAVEQPASAAGGTLSSFRHLTEIVLMSVVSQGRVLKCSPETET